MFADINTDSLNLTTDKAIGFGFLGILNADSFNLNTDKGIGNGF